MWCVEVLCAWRAVSAIARLLALITFGSSLAYGIWIKEEIARLPPNKISTVMIQGRASLKKDGQIHTLSVDREFYLRNSSLVADKDILIIWPESTIAETLPDVTHASQSNLLPYFGDGSAFFVGGVTNTGEEGWRNTSFLIRPDGSVDKPYRKTVLMPFGEHAPFSEWFPWLQAINHTAGDLIFRSNPTVLSYTLSDGRTVRIAPAICYEDLVPRLAQRATAAGAQLIINQTNELWLGNTVAPHQHHMMASFRAIENRRFLLRSTHTGVTAVVDPLGQTVAKLPSFSEAVLPMEVSLLNYRSPFTYLPVPLIWLAFAIIAGLVIVRRALRR
jgi:apolipoprotein N-acyltransferase